MVTIREVPDDYDPTPEKSTRPTSIKNTLREPIKNPTLQLTIAFAAWRAFLFAIALATPSPPYDTSASRILEPISPTDSIPVTTLKYLCEKLTRWDSIYYVKIAERGYANEQEWAFGWGYTRVLGFLGRLLPAFAPDPYRFALTGILLSTLSHYLSTLLLHRITLHLFPTSSRLAFTTALLHIITTAGIFLSAPGAESFFSLLSFAGSYVFMTASDGFFGDLQILMGGLLWGAATMVRSNGILNGVVLLWYFVSEPARFLMKGDVVRAVVRYGVLGLSGLLVGTGMVVPQGVAWWEYCRGGSGREWCEGRVPSIYTWVQSHYWNVGFLRYWTMGNIPLYVLAAPMLVVLIKSAMWGITLPRPDSRIMVFAVPQLLLAVAAITNYHTQVILRLSSGNFVWYWWVATMLTAGAKAGERDWGMWIVRWMVVYSCIQTVLFAGFLPPA